MVPSLSKQELKTKLSDNVEIYDIRLLNIKQQALEDLNGYLDVIIDLVGVYFVPGKFGIAYKTTQIRVFPQSLSKYAFIDDDDSDFSDAEPN